VDKYINKREAIPALVRAVFGMTVAYMVFIGGFGLPSERMEFAFLIEGITIAVVLASVFTPESWAAGSWLFFALDTAAVFFGLLRFGGLNSWPAFLLPLLALSASLRFSLKTAFAVTLILALAVFGCTLPSGLNVPIYQYGMWATLMLLCWSVMSQHSRSAEEAKYKMLYLDQEHINTELEERIKDLELKMQSQTIVDTVTGLKNFRYFRARIEEEILRAKRKGYVITLALIEIDDMPEFKTAYGESESRKALHKFSDILREVFRNTDLIGRNKENQFLVMMPETDPKNSLIPMMRFKKKIENHKFGPDNRFDFNLSIGISCYPNDVQEVGGLLSLVNGALKRSQQKGKGMISLASSLFKKGIGA
jgi:diguanylate cyclase (GGDEF)-like protein